jgi:hypothetical protein
MRAPDFGASADYQTLFREFGSPQNVVAAGHRSLAKTLRR